MGYAGFGRIEPSRFGHSHCLLCGDSNPLSLNLAFDACDGIVKATFQATEVLQGYDGIVHGGVISALLDAAMTHCLFHRGLRALTADLHVRFLRPVPCRAQLELRAWIASSTPRLHVVQADLRVLGDVMARADAKFLPWRKDESCDES